MTNTPFGPRAMRGHRRPYDRLFHIGDGDLPGGRTFARTGVARYWAEDGLNYEAATGVFRAGALRPTDAMGLTEALVLEEARTNHCPYSQDLTQWTDQVANTYTSVGVVAALDGTTAVKFTNENAGTSRGCYINAGVFSAGVETYSVIIEALDGTDVRFLVRNQTTTDFVAFWDVNFADGSVDVLSAPGGTGQVYNGIELGPGPNGGTLWLCTGSYTATGVGNSRRLYVYPAGGDQNGFSAVVHHVQLEEADGFSSPIISNSGATATRNLETLEIDYTDPFQEMTVYLKFIFRDGGIVNNNRYFHIGNGTASGDPRLYIDYQSGAPQLVYDNGTATVTSTPTVTMAEGDIMELRAVLYSDGSIRMWRTQNGDAETANAASAAPAGGLVAGPPSRITLGSNGDGANLIPLFELLAATITPGEQTLEVMRGLAGTG